MTNLTHYPFAGVYVAPNGTIVAPGALAAQREAIAAMHRAAQQQAHNERTFFSITFDTEGRAHDTRTGRFRARPPSTKYLSRAFVDTEETK